MAFNTGYLQKMLSGGNMKQVPSTREVETKHNGITRILVYSLEAQSVYVNGQYEEIKFYEYNSILTEKRNKMTYDQFIAACK